MYSRRSVRRIAYLVGRLDDVGVGHDVAVLRDDEARARALRLELALGPAGDRAEAAEELVERIVLGELGRARPAANALGDVDRDHGRALLLVELGEVGKRLQAPLRSGVVDLAERERGGGEERSGEGAGCAGVTDHVVLLAGCAVRGSMRR